MGFFSKTIDPDRTYFYAVEYKAKDDRWAVRPMEARDALAVRRTFDTLGVGVFKTLRQIDKREFEHLRRETILAAQGDAK